MHDEPGEILREQQRREDIEHVPTMLRAVGTFHHPRHLHDNGRFEVDCTCGRTVEAPDLREAITEMARHVEQPPSYVLQRTIFA